MVTGQEFKDLYWHQYLMIEEDFLSTRLYLEIEHDNADAYSSYYRRLILEIGSEVDVCCKALCKSIGASDAKSIGAYGKAICAKNVGFPLVAVEFELGASRHAFNPWDAWATPGISKKGGTVYNPPSWWTVYNKLKHQRADTLEIDGVKKKCHEFASQKYLLRALAGLFQVEAYHYREVIGPSTNNSLQTPTPGSRIFHLSGQGWDKVPHPVGNGPVVVGTTLVLS